MNKDTILVWFRNDLRVHDNEILWQALAKANKVVPVYIFDPRQFVALADNTQKTGVIRSKFILDSVHDLKQSLQQIGADLLVTSGYPEEILPSLAERYQVKEVYHHREVAKEETHVSTLVEEALWKKQLNLRHFIGHTLYHKEDLPFPIKDIPDAFATFRKKIERETTIRPTVDTPTKIEVPEELEPSEVPTLEELGYTADEIAIANRSPFKGGEREGLKQLNDVLRGASNDLLAGFPVDDGTLLSPWIALGCLSAHTVYHSVRAAELKGLPKKKAATIVLGLLWRDYYRFMFKKHGNRFFFVNGFSDVTVVNQQVPGVEFDNWKKGQTDDNFVNAAMKQLNAVGFMPYSARVLAAHYLVNNLGISHLLGAAYFEDKLIDYSPASNYGNWAHVAGVGSSLKDNGVKDVKKIQVQLDASGAYVERWNAVNGTLTE